MKITKYQMIAFAALMLLVMLSFKQQAPTTYWYVNGEKYHWYIQEDVFAYRTYSQDVSNIVLSDTYVDAVYFDESSRHKLNFVYFKEGTTQSERDAVKQQILNDPEFETEFPVITLFQTMPYSAGKWFVTDDIIMVNFKDSVSEAEINSFESRHNLWIFNEPSDSLPAAGNYTYLYLANMQFGNGIQQSRAIYEEDTAILENIQPNLINAYREVGEGNPTSTEELPASGNESYYVVNINNSTLKVFPELSPTRQQVYFTIYDYMGRKIMTQPVNLHAHNAEVNISYLSAGFYISTMEDGFGKVIASQKFRKI